MATTTANPVGAESLLGAGSLLGSSAADQPLPAPEGLQPVPATAGAAAPAAGRGRSMVRPGLCALSWLMLVAAIALAFAQYRFSNGTPPAPDYADPSSWDALPSSVPGGFSSEADVVPAEW